MPQWILVVAGFTIVLLLIRYVIKRVLYKGFDVVENAIKDKKNKAESHEPENLADRYKK